MDKNDVRLTTIGIAALAVAITVAFGTAWLIDSLAVVTFEGVIVGLAGAAILVAGIGGATVTVARLLPDGSPEDRVLGD